jgi:hypothetical protein
MTAPGGFYPAQKQDPGPYAGLDDNEVIEQARQIHARFQVVSRWAAENDDLIMRWGQVCREMGRRGITDTVTEAGAASVVPFDLLDGES